jgi:hypothetical protein
LAADHACKPSTLFELAVNRRQYRWVDRVLNEGRKTERLLAEAGSNAFEREKVRRQMHIDMQKADEQYVARALSDYSHFQLARDSRQTGQAGFVEYLSTVLGPDQMANATAAYANYHLAALRLAAQASAPTLDAATRSRLLAQALVVESFALHFLQDSFSAGHFVGHDGSDGVRLGTHDFYSGAGFEAVRWGDPSTTYVARGDGFMSDQERDVAAIAVAVSLTQLLRVASAPAAQVELLGQGNGHAFDEYDSCATRHAPAGLRALANATWLWDVMRFVPVPSARYPEVPRVRAEKGLFFGLAASLQGGVAAREAIFDARVLGAARVGYGAADLVNDPINAQAFGEIGFVGEHLYGEGKNDVSLTGWAFRVRAPGKFVFLDGLVAILLAESFKGSCPGCIDWAAAAASGGAGGIWQARHLFDHVYWQISFLRDFSFLLMRNEPVTGEHRYQLLAPLLSARSAVPIKGGAGVTQSTDMYLDLGASVVWSSSHDEPTYGGFVALSVAPRIFP